MNSFSRFNGIKTSSPFDKWPFANKETRVRAVVRSFLLPGLLTCCFLESCCELVFGLLLSLFPVLVPLNLKHTKSYSELLKTE